MNISKIILTALQSKAFLIISSITLGYSTWLYVSNHTTYTRKLKVPIFFYNDQAYKVLAPEVINFTIKGPRSEIYSLNEQHLGIFVNAHTLSEQKAELKIKNKCDFLGPNTQIIHQDPKQVLAKKKPLS